MLLLFLLLLPPLTLALPSSLPSSLPPSLPPSPSTAAKGYHDGAGSVYKDRHYTVSNGVRYRRNKVLLDYITNRRRNTDTSGTSGSMSGGMNSRHLSGSSATVITTSNNINRLKLVSTSSIILTFILY